MPGRRSGEADAGAVVEYQIAVGRQLVLAAVEVQQDQPPRRVTEVVNSGDCLLTPVAALAEVDGRLDPADLMRDGPVICVEAEPGPPGRYPQRLQRPGAAEDGSGCAQIGDPTSQVGARHDQVGAESGI